MAAEPSHNPDDERFACCLDDLAGDDREVVDVQDPLDLGYQPAGQAEVAAGDAGDRGDRLTGGEVGVVQTELGPVAARTNASSSADSGR